VGGAAREQDRARRQVDRHVAAELYRSAEPRPRRQPHDAATEPVGRIDGALEGTRVLRLSVADGAEVAHVEHSTTREPTGRALLVRPADTPDGADARHARTPQEDRLADESSPRNGAGSVAVGWPGGGHLLTPARSGAYHRVWRA